MSRTSCGLVLVLASASSADTATIVFAGDGSAPSARLSASCGGEPLVAWLEHEDQDEGISGYYDSAVKAYLLNVPAHCTGISLRQPCADLLSVRPPLKLTVHTGLHLERTCWASP